MCTWCQIPCAEVVGVHHRNNPATPPRTASNHMRNRDVRGSVGSDLQQINRKALH